MSCSFFVREAASRCVATRGRDKTSEGNARSKRIQEMEMRSSRRKRTRDKREKQQRRRRGEKGSKKEPGKIGIKGRKKRRSPRTSEMSYPSVSEGSLGPSAGNRFSKRARQRSDDKVLSARARARTTRIREAITGSSYPSRDTRDK